MAAASLTGGECFPRPRKGRFKHTLFHRLGKVGKCRIGIQASRANPNAGSNCVHVKLQAQVRNNLPFEIAFHSKWLRSNPKWPHGPILSQGRRRRPWVPLAPLGTLGSPPLGFLWVPLASPCLPLGPLGSPWVPLVPLGPLPSQGSRSSRGDKRASQSLAGGA